MLLEALEEAICLVDAIELNCVIQRVKEDKALSSQLVAGAWKAQVHGGRLGLEGLLLFVYSNSFSSGSIYYLEVAERFFAKFFNFLFDNTSACYLVFAFFFLSLLTFILLLCFDEYGLQ